MTSENENFDDPVTEEELDATEGFAEEEEFGFDDPGMESEGELEEDVAEHGGEASETVLEIHHQAEAALFSRPTAAFEAVAEGESVQNGANIVGVGIGSAEFDLDQIDPNGPATPVLNVYVIEKSDMDGVKRELNDTLGVSALNSDSAIVNVIPTGPIDVQSQRFKMRPAACGISVGHVRITAGTQGVLARGRRAPRNRRVLMLSNNHVLAGVNRGRPNDPIVQPGTADGGRSPRDRVALLERFVRIHTDGRPNYVDAATGWCWHRLVRKEMVYRSSRGLRLFRVSGRSVACRRGMLVGKTGRTTQLTTGRVTDCNVSIRVNMGRGEVANFRDQIAIRGLRGDFSRGGDSGSLIWTWNSNRNPVGLLFAGGGGYTFANKIGRVLSALDINLYT